MPPTPTSVTPVFVLNYDPTGVEVLPALNGLSVAVEQYPTDPNSPVFFARAGGGGTSA